LAANVATGRDRVATLRFTFELADISHLAHVLSTVKKVEGVYDAFRVVPHAQNGNGDR
jgi:GTP pyrophosphokinase